MSFTYNSSIFVISKILAGNKPSLNTLPSTYLKILLVLVLSIYIYINKFLFVNSLQFFKVWQYWKF